MPIEVHVDRNGRVVASMPADGTPTGPGFVSTRKPNQSDPAGFHRYLLTDARLEIQKDERITEFHQRLAAYIKSHPEIRPIEPIRAQTPR
jgi:hypothetical protein